MTKTRLCVVDDDESIRDSLYALFCSRNLRTTLYADPARFLSIWTTSELREVPAVFVVDIRMPGLSGIELFAAMKEHGLPTWNAVIFLTGHGDVPLAVEAIKGGAFDFLEKPFSDNGFVDRVVAAMGEVEAAHAAAQARPAPQHDALTPRERAIAELIVAGETNRAIGERLHISTRTVEVHRARVFDKLGVRNAIELALLLQGPA
ncbi:MAG TPA: response regulator [Burkholderiaceae bacterium]